MATRDTVRCWIASSAVLGLVGCASPGPDPSDSPVAAWRRGRRADVKAPTAYRERSLPEQQARLRGTAVNEPIIATVNGRGIPRRRLIDALLRSQGVSVLDRLISVEVVTTAAARQGITITDADVSAEYDEALRRLVDPLFALAPRPFDRKAAERILEAVLQERKISRETFLLVMRRNAYLRKMTAADRTFTDDELRREFERRYGRRVRVRHIQLATLGEVQRVREQLAAGEDFGALAVRYSANAAGAEAEGKLKPFSAEDEAVPEAFRRAAFKLKPGEVSGTIRIGEWYHLIKLIEVLPGQAHDFASVRDELERSLGHRRSEQTMFRHLEKLMKEATIEIHDPVLKAAYEREHAGA